MNPITSIANISKTLRSYAWRYGEINKLMSADVLLVCADADRSYVYENKKYAHLLDSVNERLMNAGLKTVTIADPYAQVYGKQAFGNVFSINGVMARATYLYAIMRRILSVTTGNNPIIKVWDKIIKKVNPKIVIGIQPSSAFCMAAKQNNISIFDLQHGALSDTGYYGYKYRNESNQQGWPDGILCWDKASAHWLEKNVPVNVTARIIGNPWFLRFINADVSDNLVKKASGLISAPSKEKPVILVTLQWGQVSSDENHELGTATALVNYIKEKGERFNWWLRIHPVQLMGTDGDDFLKKISDEFKNHDNVSWKAASENPLPLVLQYVDLHITLQSAVTIEAGWFGIKSALLNPRADLSYEYFKEQVDSGTAEIISANEREIGNWIEKQVQEIMAKPASPFPSALLNGFIDEVTHSKSIMNNN